MRKNTKKLIASLFSLILLVGLFIVPVSAAETHPAIIDTTKKGSIVIHKYDNAGAKTSVAHDGTLITDTSALGNPMKDVAFKVTKVNTAVANPYNITVAEAKEQLDASTAQTVLTDADGLAAFNDLALGIYLVEELGGGSSSSIVAPFLVSIPMTNPKDNASWLYDVNVYPKNTPLSISKSLVGEDSKETNEINADVGSTVKWNITTSIPSDISTLLADAGNYFTITDQLDSRLDFDSARVYLVNEGGQNELVDGDDYTLKNENGKITIDFDKTDGIGKLTAAMKNSELIHVTLSAKINNTALEDLADPIVNSADMNYKNGNNEPKIPSTPTDPQDPETPVVTLNGVAIFKEDPDGKALNGAEFTVYADEDAKTKLGELTKASGADGFVYFSGKELAAAESSLKNGDTVYIVETKAPAGYQLAKEVSKVTIGTTLKVKNEKLNSSFNLPVTGGTGTLLYTLVGVMLIAAAGVVFVVYRRKNRKNPTAK